MNEDIKRLVEAAQKMVEACYCGLLTPEILEEVRSAIGQVAAQDEDELAEEEQPDWLTLIGMVPDDDGDRACNRCGAGNPELDVEFCSDRRCPYKPGPRLASLTTKETDHGDCAGEAAADANRLLGRRGGPPPSGEARTSRSQVQGGQSPWLRNKD